MIWLVLLLACGDKDGGDSGTSVDGGTSDGGTSDGGTSDGGTSDGGASDGGSADVSCPLGDLNSTDDACLSIERSLGTDDVGEFGANMVPAGDSDGDGHPELLVLQVHEDDQVREWRIVEPGTHTGVAHPDDLGVARLSVDAEDGKYAGGTTTWYQMAIGDRDWDGDGYTDYLVASSSGSDAENGRLDLWHGPVAGTVGTDAAQSLTDGIGAGIFVGHPLTTLVEPVDGDDWTVAALLGPWDEDGGVEVRGALLQAGHFDGSMDPASAPKIWTEEDRAMGLAPMAADFDQDGTRDLILNDTWTNTAQLPGRIWVLSGPLDEDVSLADADLVIDGDRSQDDFGDRLGIIEDSEGVPSIVAWLPTWGPGDPSYSFFRAEDKPSSISDAYATITSDDDVQAGTWGFEDLADFDGDGEREFAAGVVDPIKGDGGDCLGIFHHPVSGTQAVTDNQGVICSPYEHLSIGQSVLGRVDYDLDGLPDLVFTDPEWGSDEETGAGPFGRLVLFRGFETY